MDKSRATFVKRICDHFEKHPESATNAVFVNEAIRQYEGKPLAFVCELWNIDIEDAQELRSRLTKLMKEKSKHSYCAVHNTYPSKDEPCWSCANPYIDKAFKEGQNTRHEPEVITVFAHKEDWAVFAKDGQYRTITITNQTFFSNKDDEVKLLVSREE